MLKVKVVFVKKNGNLQEREIDVEASEDVSIMRSRLEEHNLQIPTAVMKCVYVMCLATYIFDVDCRIPMIDDKILCYT